MNGSSITIEFDLAKKKRIMQTITHEYSVEVLNASLDPFSTESVFNFTFLGHALRNFYIFFHQ